jgi:hypothetical protein
VVYKHVYLLSSASLPFLPVSFSTMSGFINTIRKGSEFIHASTTAYDTDGAATSRSTLNSTMDDLSAYIDAGLAVSPKDAPAYLDAIKVGS